MRSILLLTGLLGISLTGFAWKGDAENRNGDAGTKFLTAQEMSELVGGDSCKDCQGSSIRQDECMHSGMFDPCSTSECIANYIIEDTCVSGAGICEALQSDATVASVSYRRLDPGCTNNNPNLSVWVVHYFGHACTTSTHYKRCTKPTNNCNGTLVSTFYRYKGIYCP